MEYTELLVIDKEDFDELKLDRLGVKMAGSNTGSPNYKIWVIELFLRFIHMEQNGRLQCFLNVPALSEFSYDDILFTVQNTKTEGQGFTDRQDQSVRPIPRLV